MILGRELSRIRHFLHALSDLEAGYEFNQSLPMSRKIVTFQVAVTGYLEPTWMAA